MVLHSHADFRNTSTRLTSMLGCRAEGPKPKANDTGRGKKNVRNQPHGLLATAAELEKEGSPEARDQPVGSPVRRVLVSTVGGSGRGRGHRCSPRTVSEIDSEALLLPHLAEISRWAS